MARQRPPAVPRDAVSTADPSSASPRKLPPLHPGSLVDHFQVVRCLGRGGMGVVYLAHDTRLGRKVALKLLDPAGNTPEASARFLQEARATALFNHPHIVTIHAVGEHRGAIYLALEYLEGRELRERINQGPLGQREAVRIALAIAQALREAHGHNVVHGDLKPENVLIPKDGRIRVLDFGLSQVIEPRAADYDEPYDDLAALFDLGPSDVHPGMRSTRPLTLAPRPAMRKVEQAAQIVGTPAYMAPEQWAGKTATGASDVWALALIVGEMIAHWHPYGALMRRPGITASDLGDEVQKPDPVVLLPTIHEHAPPPLVKLLELALSKDPAERPPIDEVVQVFEALLSTHPVSKSTAEECPFRGLEPFDERHADYFHGRDAETAAFVERIHSEPVLPVVGPSGAGKTSFVQAGVLPRLREQTRCVVIRMCPGADPFGTLAARLLAADERNQPRRGELQPPPARRQRDLGERTTIMRKFPDGLRLRRELSSEPQLLALSLRSIADRTSSRVVLFVDQLEEICTLVDDPQVRRSFMETLCRAADDRDDPVRVIFALRDDFLARLAETPRSREVLGRVTIVHSPDADALNKTVVDPLARIGYAYDDPHLPHQMVSTVLGEPACLPLLQFTTRMLWDRRDQQRKLLLRAAYEAIGGVGGALAAHADGVLRQLTPERRTIARDILLRLVSPDGQRRVLPRSELVAQLGSEGQAVLAQLTEARLIISRGADDADDDAALELVHPSLLESWSQLERWVREGREDLRFIAEISEAANLWERRGRRAEEVWQGDALHEAERKRVRATQVPPQVLRFIAAGRALQRKRNRRRRALLFGGALMALLLAGGAAFGVWAVVKRERLARSQRDRARARLAEAQREAARAALLHGDLFEARARIRAALQADDNPSTRALWRRIAKHPSVWTKRLGGVPYSLAAARDGDLVLAGSQDGKLYAIDRASRATRILGQHTDQVFAIAARRDTVVSSTLAGKIRLWKLDGTQVRTLRPGRGAVRALALSPDARQLASTHAGGWLLLTDIETGKIRHRHRPGKTRGLAFSPDGKLLASGGANRSIHLWDAATGKRLRMIRGHSGAISALAFSPDGKLLASGSWDGTIRLWRVADGSPQGTLTGHGGVVASVDFSTDGSLLASGGTDQTVRLWRADSGKQLAALRGHRAAVYSVRFAGEHHLASSAADRTVRLWDVPVAIRARSGGGHDGSVNAVAIAPGGKTIASAGNDHSVQLWNREDGSLAGKLVGHSAAVIAVAYGPDGRLLATGGRDATVRVWDAASRAVVRVLSGHRLAVTGVSFSPDGSLLASSGWDGTTRIWNLATGGLERQLSGHEAPVSAVAFSPDGTLLATGSVDRTVRLSTITKGKVTRVRVLRGHRDRIYGLQFSPDGRLLASSGADGRVLLWRMGGPVGKPRKLAALDQQRAYRLAFTPDSSGVVVAASDGRVRLYPLDGGDPRVIGRHRTEANGVAVTPDGQQVATAGDDGTVRLWQLASGMPAWRTIALLRSPALLVSHRGVLPLRTTGKASDEQLTGCSTGCLEALRTSRMADARSKSPWVCMQTANRKLQLWRRGDASERPQRETEPIADVTRLWAHPRGCLLLVDDQLVLRPPAGATRSLATGVTAVSLRPDGTTLVARAGGVRLLDATLRPRRVVTGRSDRAITAVAALGGDRYALGLASGEVALAGDQVPTSVSFEGVEQSAVTSLIRGPAQTLVGGHADGTVALWSVRDGSLLDRTRLHGAATQLVSRDDHVYAASTLGDSLSWDLSFFTTGRCEALRTVWRIVPVVWEAGRAVVRRPPADHPCRTE